MKNFAVYNCTVWTSHPVETHLHFWNHVFRIKWTTFGLLRLCRIILHTIEQPTQDLIDTIPIKIKC